MPMTDPPWPDPTPAFTRRFDSLAAIGRDATSGAYHRFSWTAVDRAARAWFTDEAVDLGLRVDTDRFGNLWAWWPDVDGDSAIATGSHLDTVPGGGAYDGALGVVAALGAAELLRDTGFRPKRPLAIAVFTEEEGARFGMATLGSRLAAGRVDPVAAFGFRDVDGVTLGDAMRAMGLEPGRGEDGPSPVARLGCFVELHIEQGRRQADLGAPIAVATEIVPHGRWRLTVTGDGNHAGTTRLADRHDPSLPMAEAILSARRHAERHGAVATVGRVEIEPNGTNVIPSRIRAWLDARAPEDAVLTELVRDWSADAVAAGAVHGCEVAIAEESRSAAVRFDPDLTGRIQDNLSRGGQSVPAIATAAGHDAGILASSTPTAMIFVRNPTGISHAAAEAATVDDCVAGVRALATVLADLAG